MDSSQLTRLRDHYFKQQKKDFLVISEKENYADLKLTEREVCGKFQNAKNVSLKSLKRGYIPNPFNVNFEWSL